MPKKKKQKKITKKKSSASQPQPLSPGQKGLIALFAASIGLFSLFTFAYIEERASWLAEGGYLIGWLLFALFGLLSYPLCLALLFFSKRAFFKEKIVLPKSTLLWGLLALGSTGLLLSLFEEQLLSHTDWPYRLIYPAPWKRNFHFHLSGAPLYYLYRDLPDLNLISLIGSSGTLLLSITCLITSLTALSERSVMDLLKGTGHLFTQIKSRLRRPERSSPWSEEAVSADAPLTVLPQLATAGPEPTKKTQLSRREAALLAQRVHNGDFNAYSIPPPSLLPTPKKTDHSLVKKELRQRAEVLEETLLSFGIEARVGQINCGPTIACFEVHPATGVKVQKIKSLENDIALNLKARSIRILAPIPGKAAIGIEIPNPKPQLVGFKEILTAYQQSGRRFTIPLLLGKTVNGDYVMNDLAKMPHCIIAGATGSGKSVCINTIVMSILMTARPDQIKLLMVDPKKVELTPYSRLPHMLAPVITEPLGACSALQWLVREMEGRYEILKQVGVRNIDSFNKRKTRQKVEEEKAIPEKMHYIVAIIDELADLMMVSGHDTETAIARIAQMARAVGIHLILATQRPSREVITGLIKANFPTRIAFKVASRINSQIILDEVGAEQLLGNGDLLFLPPGSSQLIRAQGAFLTDQDIYQAVDYICQQAPPNYAIESFDEMEGLIATNSKEEEEDPLYTQAVQIVSEAKMASTTYLQRRLKIGYARAASLIDQLEEHKIIGPAEGSKPRRVLEKE